MPHATIFKTASVGWSDESGSKLGRRQAGLKRWDRGDGRKWEPGTKTVGAIGA